MSVELESESVAAAREGERREPQSIATLVRRLAHQLATLLRNELALASAELVEAARALLTGAMAALAGSAILFAGLLVLLSSAVLGLSLVLAPWLAALIVGAAVSVAGVVALLIGVRRLSAQSLKPARTTRSLLKDKDALLRRAQ